MKNIWWKIGLVLIIGLMGYLNRWIFVYKFEPEYWENYYYESQWNVPNSKRMIGDEGVYRYIGYRLVNGENPFNVDYWVPPLGKYMYGLAAKYLQNPYWISFIGYVAAIGIFWLLADQIFETNTSKWLSTYLFALNPLLVEQIGQTMLDLPMTIFLMLSVYFALKINKDKVGIFAALSGICLGLMAGTKPAYFVPMFGLVIMVWLYFKAGVKAWFYFCPSVIAGYVGSYFCYWIAHPNPIPWIRLHQKVIEFQKNNAGSHDPISIFRVIFLDAYKGFWVNAKTIRPLNWSVVLPVGTLGAVWLVIRRLTSKIDEKIILIVSLSLGYMFMNIFIDFWPRYFMPLIPLLTLIIGYLTSRNWKVMAGIIVLTLPSLYLLLFQPAQSFSDYFKSEFKNGFYKETYRLLDFQSRSLMSESEWKNISYSEEKIIPVKENNQWRIKWLSK